jgi:hypothetical protein
MSKPSKSKSTSTITKPSTPKPSTPKPSTPKPSDPELTITIQASSEATRRSGRPSTANPHPGPGSDASAHTLFVIIFDPLRTARGLPHWGLFLRDNRLKSGVFTDVIKDAGDRYVRRSQPDAFPHQFGSIRQQIPFGSVTDVPRFKKAIELVTVPANQSGYECRVFVCAVLEELYRRELVRDAAKGSAADLTPAVAKLVDSVSMWAKTCRENPFLNRMGGQEATIALLEMCKSGRRIDRDRANVTV